MTTTSRRQGLFLFKNGIAFLFIPLCEASWSVPLRFRSHSGLKSWTKWTPRFASIRMEMEPQVGTIFLLHTTIPPPLTHQDQYSEQHFSFYVSHPPKMDCFQRAFHAWNCSKLDVIYLWWCAVSFILLRFIVRVIKIIIYIIFELWMLFFNILHWPHITE